MINKLTDWYTSMPLNVRPLALFLLVPALEYFCLEPARHALNAASAVGQVPGFVALPFMLAFLVLLAAVIVLFVLEFFKVISKVQGPFAARFCLLLLYGWVLLPLYLMKHYGQ